MKRKKMIVSVISLILITGCGMRFALCASCQATKVSAKEWEGQVPYPSMVDAQEYPQTIVHDMVMEFLKAPLAEGKTEKKVMVLGYDGFRRDVMELRMRQESGAISLLSKEGSVYLTYAGGDQNQQATSTAPGWTSILTGVWAQEHGVYDNGDTKPANVDTCLTKAARAGYAAAFVASWPDHFTTTYVTDLIHADLEALDVRYAQMIDDAGTLAQVLMYVTKDTLKKDPQQDPDVIFAIFDESDETGHRIGFGPAYPQYLESCALVDAWGQEIITAIKERISYEQEEWLILLTTDHGGIDSGHGNDHIEETSTFLIRYQS